MTITLSSVGRFNKASVLQKMRTSIASIFYLLTTIISLIKSTKMTGLIESIEKKNRKGYCLKPLLRTFTAQLRGMTNKLWRNKFKKYRFKSSLLNCPKDNAFSMILPSYLKGLSWNSSCIIAGEIDFLLVLMELKYSTKKDRILPIKTSRKYVLTLPQFLSFRVTKETRE